MVDNADKKLRELILYISTKCQHSPKFGATKLNKILYWADFLHFGRAGVPITGLPYKALPNGPAPQQLLPARGRLVDDGDLRIDEIPTMKGKPLMKTVALREPDLGYFSGSEIAMVDSVIEMLMDSTADQVSDQSHGAAWQCANEADENIPYATIFVSSDEPTEDDIRWAMTACGA